MKIIFLEKFLDKLGSFPALTQKKFQKQLKFLISSLRHPSLRAKKYDESANIWQARVNKGVRFYFVIENDRYILINIKYHPK